MRLPRFLPLILLVGIGCGTTEPIPPPEDGGVCAVPCGEGCCAEDEVCNAFGRCEPPACQPDCRNRTCGPDGCGGECGYCGSGTFCDEEVGRCRVCEPDCGGM
jgi:hypothetical protein